MGTRRIFLEAPDGTPMVSSAMTRERAIAFALDLRRLGDLVLRIETESGEIVEAAEIEAARVERVSHRP